MHIEIANIKDSEELSKLLVILMTQEEDFIPDFDRHKQGIELLINSPEMGCILCLKEEGEIIGMIGILYAISTALGSKVATFEDFIIRPEYRSKGYGKMLFAQAIKTAKAAQCQRITLLTDQDNMRAQTFYRQQGMQASAMCPYRLML